MKKKSTCRLAKNQFHILYAKESRQQIRSTVYNHYWSCMFALLDKADISASVDDFSPRKEVINVSNGLVRRERMDVFVPAEERMWTTE